MKTSKAIAFLLLGFMVVASISWATERQGANIIVLKKDNFQLRGELIAVKPDSLVLLLNQRNAGTDLSVDVKDIAEIRIPKKSHTVLGIGVGLLAGLGVGFLARPHSESQAGSFSSMIVEPIIEQYAGIGVVVLSVTAGAAVGGIIGAVAGSDTVYPFRDRNEQSVKSVLLSLSQKARVKGLQ